MPAAIPNAGRRAAILGRVGLLVDRRKVAALFELRGPVIVMRDADASGVPRTVLRRLVDSGDLTRVGKSAFAPSAALAGASAWDAFRLRAIGFALCAGPDRYLTGAAAAAVLKLPVVSDPPDLPVALRPGSAHIGHDRSPHGRVRHGFLPPMHRTTRAGVQTVSPAYCAIDVARHLGPVDGLVVADRVLGSGVGRDELAWLASSMEHYPGIQTARWVVERADGRAESPLETLGRLAFLSADLPPPLSNVWIPAGRRWYRVDHLLADTGVILEADGALKYDDRPDAGAQVSQDRRREWDLRRAGYAVVRYDFATARFRPQEIPRRARDAARQRGTAPVPTGWTLTPDWFADHAWAPRADERGGFGTAVTDVDTFFRAEGS